MAIVTFYQCACGKEHETIELALDCEGCKKKFGVFFDDVFTRAANMKEVYRCLNCGNKVNNDTCCPELFPELLILT